ncbi:phospholipid-translocating ATPase rsb1 [Kalmusia sp. IMI 367209]|nr:phospholipid-translocating ATPase rsb1 [Kalmusia sp. IMI 367209]
MNQAHDVSVVLDHEHKYSFHSGTLARSSTLFAELFTEPNAAKLSLRARQAGIKTRWLVELKEMPSVDHPAGRLDLVKLTSTGERADGFPGRVLNENGRVPTKVFDYWERVLYAFYGTDIRVADADMGAALSDCVELIKIAEYLGCVSLIGKPVEVALVKQGQSLFRAIQTKPYAWADMSYRIRSELIFREAIIHLAGHWNKWKKSREAMAILSKTPGAKSIVDKYHHRLTDKGKKLESKLMSHYPGDMPTPKADIPIKREEYAKDILIWIALGWFRHWFGQRIIADKGHNAEDGGFELYKSIAAGGDAYMDKAILSQFHQMFPMTKKALNVVENHLLEIKECMAEWVAKSNILKSTCQLNIDQYPVRYITSTDFENSDFPWVKEELAKANKKGKRPGGNEIAQRNLEAAKHHQVQRQMFSDDDDLEEGVVDDNADEEPVRAHKRNRFE